MRHGDAALDAASDSVRPLTTNGCDESRLMANWLKGQKVEIERVLVSPFLRAEQTLEEVGDCLNLPSSAEVLPELTPCGDVGLVSAYLQALTNEGVASVLALPPLTVSWVSGRRVMSGRNAAYVYHLGHCQRNA